MKLREGNVRCGTVGILGLFGIEFVVWLMMAPKSLTS